ncbi:MAG TPA: PHP domain-containing protein, partial [Allocoleopsis sp.]
MKYKGKYSGRIISYDQAQELIKDGYFAIDPHCHSSYSYDVPDVIQTSPDSVLKVQKMKGLKHILTDHDTLNGYKYLRRKDYDVIPAVELTFRPKIIRKVQSSKPAHMLHINIFGLNENDLIILKDIARRGDLDELVKYCKDNDLDWMYNHPLYHEKYEKLNWQIIPGLAKNYFDVIELNSQFSKGLNDINQRIAEKLGKGIVASSDSHTGNPGTGFVLAEGKNFKEFWENVKEGKMYIVRKDMGTFDVVKEASLMIKHTFNANPRPRIEKKFT